MLLSPYVFTSAPFLDVFTGAAAAYSLRQLRTGVTNVVRVRRSSDNAEQDFTAAQVTDGTLTAFCGTGNGFVRTWYDQSGNSRHANQSTSANQPLIVYGGTLVKLGDRPCLSFGVSGSSIRILKITSYTSKLEPLSVMFAVDSASTGVIFSKNSSAAISTTDFPFLINSAVNFVNVGVSKGDDYNYDATRSLQKSQNGKEFVFVVQTSSLLSVTVNSTTSQVASVSQSTNSQEYTIGGYAQLNGGGISAPENFTGVLPELILYGSDQTSNRANIAANIRNYYSIS